MLLLLLLLLLLWRAPMCAQADADWHRPSGWDEAATPHMMEELETGIELNNMYSFKVGLSRHPHGLCMVARVVRTDAAPACLRAIHGPRAVLRAHPILDPVWQVTALVGVAEWPSILIRTGGMCLIVFLLWPQSACWRTVQESNSRQRAELPAGGMGLSWQEPRRNFGVRRHTDEDDRHVASTEECWLRALRTANIHDMS
jgi:hypothetical protein